MPHTPVRAALAAPLALCLAAVTAAPASATTCCGAGGPCAVEGGEYRIDLPPGDGPHPALLFVHGYGGSAEGALRRVARAVERGYAVIAPQGLRRDGADGPTSWSFRPESPERRDESAFFRAVLEDAAARHGIDRDRVLLGGFSIGGSMTHYLACEDPAIARAYAPVAGAFWRPHPPLDACAGAVDLHHTHGWSDGTVPLEGRVLGGGRVRQGDVFHALRTWREANGCDRLWPDEIASDGGLWTREWTSCDAGSLRLDLHPGGHSVPDGWTDRALDWFERLPSPEG